MKNKGLKAKIVLGVGLILVSLRFWLKDILSDNICDCITGFGLGLEIVGIFKYCKARKENEEN